jgi:3,4-dihydroxy-2-butanone 4-phosphate synthase
VARPRRLASGPGKRGSRELLVIRPTTAIPSLHRCGLKMISMSAQPQRARDVRVTGPADAQSEPSARSTRDRVIEARRAIARRQMVLVGSQRSREGSLVMAAQFVTPAAINLMDAHRYGPIYTPMLAGRLDELDIPPMLLTKTDLRNTSRRVGVDHRWAALTGETAGDRVAAIWALADPASSAGDFTRPGHVVPLAYIDGGVLKRPGRAEAAIDLVSGAGLRKVAMICTIADGTGNMATSPQLERFARELGLSYVSVEDLVADRRDQVDAETREHSAHPGRQASRGATVLTTFVTTRRPAHGHDRRVG